jgi:Fur family transcriptional regulator, peroxide stress response regulator
MYSKYMPHLTLQQLEERIRASGLRMTPQRRAIVDYLASTQHHPTAEEIYNLVNARFPMTSRSTVYNTLTFLKDAGLVQELCEDGIRRFDPNLGPHHHFICRQCGKVEDVEADRTEQLVPRGLPGARLVEAVEITFRGLCEACRATL